MAAYRIIDVTDNRVQLKSLNIYDDIFTLTDKKYKKDNCVITFADLVKYYFSDNNNFKIYDVNICEKDEDMEIKISNIYSENEKGYHIFSNIDNILVINKKIYNETAISIIVKNLMENVKKEKEYKLSEYKIEENEIRDTQYRVMPQCCEFIDKYLNYSKSINIDDYHITYEELSDYVKNNENFIRSFIRDNWKNLHILTNILIGTISVSFIVSMYLCLMNKYDIPLQVSSIIFFASSIAAMLSFIQVEDKIGKFEDSTGMYKRNLKRIK